MSELVTVGETMGLLTTVDLGTFRQGSLLRMSMAGAESNVAIGFARLGHDATWLGRVGNDEIGRLILGCLRAEGVSVGDAVVDPDGLTGVMLKERRTSQLTRAFYYRQGQAGSRLSPDDINEQAIADARVLHLTGITPALSQSARDATFHAARVAREAGTLVSVDVNYRTALWARADAAEVLRVLVSMADLAFVGDDEVDLLVAERDPVVAARRIALLGPSEVVVKRGAKGAIGFGEGNITEVDGHAVTVVDVVGAGDAFAAGYLAALLEGDDLAGRLRLGGLVASFSVTVPGDWEGLPRRADLLHPMLNEGSVVR